MAGGGSSELREVWKAVGFLTQRIEELEASRGDTRDSLRSRVEELEGRLRLVVLEGAKPVRKSRAKKA